MQKGSQLDELYAIIADINCGADAKSFLEDLCTYKEIEQMAQRVTAAKMLIEGKTYSQVIAVTEISSATLSRVSKCLHHGSGGYIAQLQKRMSKKEGE